MSRHGKRRSAKQTTATAFVVALICALAGYLFAINVQSNGSTTVSSDTEDLLAQRTKSVNQLQKDITDLSSQVETLKKTLGSDQAQAGNGSGAAASTSENQESTANVLPAYSGPGITVTLSDSTLWQDAQTSGSNLSDTNVNDYVVHQQDLEAVINAMWAGGAEAMMIQDQRVLPTTAVRCVGNVLLLQGKQYAPPYKVSAIGPINGMQKALDASQAVKIYREDVDSIGLGWGLQISQNLTFPKTTAVLQTLKYASEIK